jgi:hypothetical protein
MKSTTTRCKWVAADPNSHPHPLQKATNACRYARTFIKDRGPKLKNKVHVTWPNGCRKRTLASINGTGGNTLPYGSINYTDYDVVSDSDEPSNPDKKWIQLPDKWFIATRYPSSEGVERAQVEAVSDNGTPPGSQDTVTVTVETSDGKRGSATIELK